MNDKYAIDFTDSHALWKFTMETCRVAESYAQARNKHAYCTKEIKVRLARAYSKHKVDLKHSEDKAVLILAEQQETVRNFLREQIEAEAQYKGLEKVLEARHAAQSFNQSLIKNMPK